MNDIEEAEVEHDTADEASFPEPGPVVATAAENQATPVPTTLTHDETWLRIRCLELAAGIPGSNAESIKNNAAVFHGFATGA